jgi:transposase
MIPAGDFAMRVKRRNDPNVRAFWTRHVALWMRSAFSQGEYCARNGISRSLMSKWWIWLREDRAREERIKIGRCRGRHRLRPMPNELGHRTNDVTNLSPAAVLKERADRPVVRRRRFSEEEKRHFLDLAGQPGSSFSDVAQRYDIALSLLFRWRKEFGEGPAPFAGFTPVDITDDALPAAQEIGRAAGLTPSRVPLEGPTGAMEIALKDGKRLRVEPGADPDAVRRLIVLLEGASP